MSRLSILIYSPDMNPQTQHSLMEGISYSDRLPVTWEILSGLPSDGECHRLNRANEELLQHLLLLDEAPQDTEEKEEGGGQEHIIRLEAKIDLLLGLVTEMMAGNGNLPERHDVTLGAHGIIVQGGPVEVKALKVGMPLRVRLYLAPQFPRPLELFGNVAATQGEDFTVTYNPLEEGLQSLLDKYVFRQHRRAIAMARRRETP